MVVYEKCIWRAFNPLKQRSEDGGHEKYKLILIYHGPICKDCKKRSIINALTEWTRDTCHKGDATTKESTNVVYRNGNEL